MGSSGQVISIRRQITFVACWHIGLLLSMQSSLQTCCSTICSTTSLFDGSNLDRSRRFIESMAEVATQKFGTMARMWRCFLSSSCCGLVFLFYWPHVLVFQTLINATTSLRYRLIPYIYSEFHRVEVSSRAAVFFALTIALLNQRSATT